MRRLTALILAAALTACQPSGEVDTGLQSEHSDRPVSTPELCETEATPIASIQGTTNVSAYEGRQAQVRGIVTYILPQRGLFIQEERPTDFGRASHGLFVDSPALAQDTTVGELLALEGTILELGEHEDTITSISMIEQYAECGEGADPPELDARLPLSREEREAFEGMRILLEQPLTVTAVRDISKGQVLLSALGLLKAPTEVALPGEAALAIQQKNREWSLMVRDDHLKSLEPLTSIQAGALVQIVSGVLGHDGEQTILFSETALNHVSYPLPEVEQAGAEEIRVVAYNLHEYFNGDGRGGGFPGERGAETAEEFENQSVRLVSAVARLNPDVLGVIELENDGFGPESAIEHLRQAISDATGFEFAVATPASDRVGTDAINVGILYRTSRVQAVGQAQLLEGGSFGPLNRVPLAQVFASGADGERFIVVVNHLKSKGWCPDTGNNTDQGDGQACWNDIRVEGATETLSWAEKLAEAAKTDNFLLIGDFNAYRMEDPIRAIEASGMIELVARHNPDMFHHTYIFKGAAGSLDYAFASAALANRSTRGFTWNINSGYPYAANPSEPWLRSSDHDPVVVDLLFNQSATSD